MLDNKRIEINDIVRPSIVNTDQVNGRFRKENSYRLMFAISGTIAILLLVGVFITMLSYGWPFITDLQRFFEILTSTDWYPEDEFDEGTYGALAMIYGTFIVGVPALLMAIFFGVGGSIFLSEYMPNRVTRMIQPVVEYIAAIPSVVFGLITFVYISAWVKEIFNVSSGRGPLAASIALAFMASPIIVSISIDALQSTPAAQRNAAKAFGATRYEVLRAVVLPHAKESIFSSILLGFGRVLGETMVVLMVLGNSPVIKWNLFSSAYTLTSAIANEIGDARFGSAEFSVLFVLALILLTISFLVVYTSNLITSKNPTFFKVIRVLMYPFGLISKFLYLISQQFSQVREFSREQISKRIQRRNIFNYVFAGFLGSVLAAYVLIVFIMLFQVLFDGFPGIDLEFLLSWPTYSRMVLGKYGVNSAIIGSLAIVIMAALISFPIATVTGIYLSEFAKDNRLNRYIRMAIVNISSIPSIVVGLFVYGAFSIGLDWETGILPGGIALGVMMIPIVTTNTIEALRNIPLEHKNSALALGSSNWEAVKNHRLPYAFPSIITGYVLAIARVIGETAPLLLTAAAFVFDSDRWPNGLIRAPVRALPYEIYYNLLFSTWDEAVSWALSTAVVLLAIIALLSILAYYLRKRLRSRYEYQGSI